jgi:hypothetical protein
MFAAVWEMFVEESYSYYLFATHKLVFTEDFLQLVNMRGKCGEFCSACQP